MDDIHTHPTVQQLLRWQRRHHYLLAVLAAVLAVVTVLWVRDYYFVPRVALLG